MSRVAIELNDWGVVVLPADGDPQSPSPGVALVDGDNIITGREASARARLEPRRAHDRFWDRIELAPLPRPFPEELCVADLAWAHVGSVWRRAALGVDQAVLAVPGVFTADRLGLVVGVARAAGVPVCGLVDAAVAACAGRVAGTRVLHLDMTRHRAVVSELVQEGGAVERVRVEASEQVGLAPLHDLWARWVAELFVRRTRFDPLHLAATEQELYDALPGLLVEIGRRPEVHLRMSAGGREHAVTIDRKELVEAAAGAYEHLVALATRAGAGADAPLYVSHRVAALPGLQEWIREAGGGRPEPLPELAATAGALAHAEAIVATTPDLPWIVRLEGVGAAS